MGTGVSRICRQVQAQLPRLVDATLSRPRRRLVGLHLRRCEACQLELDRQRDVAAGLGQLEEAAAVIDEGPPEGLLDALLEQADRPGVRGRAAVPARGAVSGARPGLSLLFLVAGALTGTAAGYATWRAVTTIRQLLTRSRA